MTNQSRYHSEDTSAMSAAYCTSGQDISGNVKIGCAVSLMSMHSHYQDLTVADIVNYIIAPISLDQCYLFVRDDVAVGMITWAYLPDDIAHMKVSCNRAMKVDDWRSGAELWGVEFIALPGHVRYCLEQLKGVLPGNCKRIRINDYETIRGRYGRILHKV